MNQAPSVRSGAAVFDACPKNIDIYVTDIGQRVDALKALGYNFRSATHSEVTADDGTRFREMHIGIHDDINLVLLELPDQPIPTNMKRLWRYRTDYLCCFKRWPRETLLSRHIGSRIAR